MITLCEVDNMSIAKKNPQPQAYLQHGISVHRLSQTAEVGVVVQPLD
jgi:hypothetical protein